MKRLFILSVLLTICFTSIKAQISGRIINSKQEPLIGATVILVHLPDSANATTKIANTDGRFVFTNVKPGKYVIKTTMVSFTVEYSNSFVYDAKAVSVENILLKDDSRNLNAVTVTATRPMLEQKSDRLVVNVEKLNTTGDNALEVLKKAPGIRLDKDDNILYRNNGGVTVMIDGKRTYMSGTELSNYLKSLPGNVVSKIELIANPPGNYDAEGSAGMINIILKRNKLQGYNGTATFNAGYGKYGKIYGGLNLNYNTGKLSMYTRVNSGYFDSYNKLTLSRQIGNQQYNQFNYWHPTTTSTGYTVGADYYLSNKHTIGFMFKGYNAPLTADVTSVSNTINSTGKQIGSVTGVNPRVADDNTYNFNLNYSFAIDTIGQKFTVDADYVYHAGTDTKQYTNTYFDEQSTVVGSPILLRSNQPVDYFIKSIKGDYSYPFAKTWVFEAGLKSSWVTTNSNTSFDSLKTGAYVTDLNRSNNFNYNENINAAYATLNKTIGSKLDVKASLRTEQTISTANSLTTNQVVKRNYWQFFPSAFITYKINAQQQLNASFSRRISRPGYSTLNSAITYVDPYTATQGNPYLQPSISQSYVFNYTYKSFQVLSLSYLVVHDAVNTVVTQNDQTKESIAHYQNLGKTKTLTATSAGSFNVTKWWNMSAEVDGAYDNVNTVVESQPFHSSKFSWSANTDQTLTLPKSFKVQLSASYYSASISGLARTLPGSQIDAGISKTFMNKKATVSFKVRDIFFGNRYRSILQYNNVNTTWNNEWESRRFTLGFSFQFGNTKLKTARARQTGSTTEEGRM
jgi:hypothetical protein